MTQEQLILEHLKSAGNITTLEAIETYHILRPAEIIRLLRKEHNIRTEQTQCLNRFGKVVHYAKYIYEGEKEGDG